MKFTFIANACGIFTGSAGTRILTDPWLHDGVFEGSWCHFPKLTTTEADVCDVDAIFVSHIHPDHFDTRYFHFPVETPILILARPENFLKRNLERMGYKNIIEFEDGKTAQFAELSLTLFAPFTTHNFHDAVVGNILDSALVLEDQGVMALNANDNTPTPEAARFLTERFGRFDLVMLNYNSAGPYPSCFDNLSIDEKRAEHSRLLSRNFDYIVSLTDQFQPRALLPFAGAYVLGGSQGRKNPFLGTTTWEVCRDAVLERRPDLTVVLLREGDTLDLVSMEADRPYVPLDMVEMVNYIEQELPAQVYDYERDVMPNDNDLVNDLQVAAVKMIERASRFGLSSNARVAIRVGQEEVQVLPGSSVGLVPSDSVSLLCSMDPRLLRRILDRRAHWNNVEIGCHIDFFRSPNVYDPDLHTMLQFLHL